MTEDRSTAGSLPTRHGLWVEVVALACVLSGPVAMRSAGLPLPFGAALLGGTVASVAVGRLDRAGARLAVVAATTAALHLLDATTAGLWIAISLLLVDSVLRQRSPWPGLTPAHRSTVVPLVGLLLLAALRTPRPPSIGLGPTFVVLIVGLALVVVIGLEDRRLPRTIVLGGVVGVFAVASIGGHEYRFPRPVVPVLVLAALVVLWSTLTHRGERPWAPARALGPLCLAVPAMFWWMTNVGLAVAGHGLTGQRGYRAWTAYRGTLDPVFNDVSAFLAVPATVAGLLGIGAYLTVRGARGLRTVAVAVAGSLTAAAVVAWAWQLGAPPA